MNHDLLEQMRVAVSRYDQLSASLVSDKSRLSELEQMLVSIRDEQSLLETSKEVLVQVRNVLTKTSLDYCEKLATSAVQTIFKFNAEVKYAPSDNKFYLVFLDTGYRSDLSANEGGGCKVVISLIFMIYLLVKTGTRRLVFADEAWTQVSDEYFPTFLSFIRQLCKELDFDICLVSHDVRISLEDVDMAYVISEGVSKRVK